MHNLGLVLQARGNYTQARAEFERVLAILLRNKASETRPAAQVISSLGWVDFDQGNYAAAEQRARAAMQLRRKLGGDTTPEFAVSLIQVAEARLYQRDPRTAAAMLRQALEIRRQRLLARHPDIASAVVRLGGR